MKKSGGPNNSQHSRVLLVYVNVHVSPLSGAQAQRSCCGMKFLPLTGLGVSILMFQPLFIASNRRFENKLKRSLKLNKYLSPYKSTQCKTISSCSVFGCRMMLAHVSRVSTTRVSFKYNIGVGLSQQFGFKH